MYNSENSDPVYALNQYVWRVLEANLGWDADNYEAPLPIVPSSQQPELLASGHPFIVYGANYPPVAHLYVLRNCTVAYNIYSTSSTEVNNVVELFLDAFEGQDESAARVNNFLDAEGRNRGITFGTIRPTFAEKAEPAESEGGYAAGMVMLDLKYTQSRKTALLDFDTV